MPIERLVYNEDQANPNPQNLRYGDNDEGTIIAADDAIGVVLTFKAEEYMKEDSPMHNSIFRMGWNTATVFEKQPNGPLQINRVYDITTGMEKNIQYLSGIPFKQITTQAVDSCTLLYIETDNECLLAHFELDRAGDFAALLEEKFPVTKSNYVFYSGGGAKAYQRVARDDDNSKKRGYNRLVQWTRRCTLIVFDRMVGYYDKGNPNYNHFAHMEFGIGWDGETATYFGDIIYSNDENISANSCPCHIFECNQIRDLSDMKVWARSLTVSDVGLDVDSLEEV